jgi:D-beta-D-heptose 7-phosphate kinase/D-beta-D-heptose 1-phosphate adenosyltransferase
VNHGLTPLVDAFAGLEALVIGEAMLDSYLEGASGRLCREAPVPIDSVRERRDAPGGAANTAVNAAVLGARVHFLSVVGEDPEATLLRRALEAGGVVTAGLLADPERFTLSKNRVMAGSQLLVRFDQGSTRAVDTRHEQALIDRLNELYPRCDAVIVSDYVYGILTPRVIDALGWLQRRHPAPWWPTRKPSPPTAASASPQ